jgi:hypothetical protein
MYNIVSYNAIRCTELERAGRGHVIESSLDEEVAQDRPRDRPIILPSALCRLQIAIQTLDSLTTANVQTKFPNIIPIQPLQYSCSPTLQYVERDGN